MYKIHKYWFKIFNLLLFAAFQAIDKEILKINISCLLAIYFDFLAFWLIAHPENVYYAHTSLCCICCITLGKFCRDSRSMCVQLVNAIKIYIYK